MEQYNHLNKIKYIFIHFKPYSIFGNPEKTYQNVNVDVNTVPPGVKEEKITLELACT